MSISLKAMATGSALVALACLTALVIAVSVRQVDVLSIVALALAILAFAIQIIVFAFQAAETAASSQRSLKLHSELSGLLSELRERTGSTQKSVDSINERLLEAIIGKTKSGGLNPSTEEFAERVAADYTRAAASVASESTDDPYPDPLPAAEASLIHTELSTWPQASDIADISQTLNELTSEGQLDLMRLADDALKFTRTNTFTGPGVPLIDNSVLTAGLAEKVPGWQLYTLSPEGRRIARILTASGEFPTELQPLKSTRQAILKQWEEWIPASS